MDLGEREIVDPREIDRIVAEQRYKENMEGVKEGYPYEDILTGENSLFQQYVDRKTAEYNERMQTFDEEIAEMIAKKRAKDGGASDDELDELEEQLKKESSNKTTMKPQFVDDLDLD